jgi:STE24 endopeptidase
VRDATERPVAADGGTGAPSEGAPATEGAARLWRSTAVLLALLGAVLTVWRPVAPPLTADLPPQATFDAELLAVIAAYRAPRLALVPLVTVLWVLVPVLLACWPRARAVVRRWTGDRAHAPWRAGLVAGVVAVTTWAVTLPIVAWLGVVHEGRWGFRTATPAEWLRDQVLVSGGRWLAIGFGVTVLLAARTRWPRTWPYRLTVLATLLAGVLVVVHPVLLQPLLLNTSPLTAGPTRDAVDEVLAGSQAAGLPVVVADASRRTTRVNAHITGLGPTEQVVLYDTLLELPPAQVAGVLAHELAHQEHADVARGTLLTATAALIGLLLLQRLLDAPTVRRRVGVRAPGDPRLVLVVVAAAAVLELVGTPIGGAISRRLEAAADHRAFELGADPAEVVRTVRTFVVRDLAAPDPGGPIRVVYGTHPTPNDRLRAAAAAAERAGTPLPGIEELVAEERGSRHPRAGEGPG